MLIYRLLTAAILIPLVLFLLFYLDPPAFCVGTGLFMLAAAAEWTSLMGLSSILARIAYLVLFAALLLSTLFIPTEAILFVATLWWIIALVLVLCYPRGKSWWSHRWVKGVMGVFVLLPCWVALNVMRAEGSGIYIILFVFALIWGADSTAYFVGKRFGRTKLLPEVSPGKSWQGVMGALIYTVLAALMAIYLTGSKPPFAVVIGIVSLAVVTVIFSIIGDLFESMLKRDVGLKDSGCILPGHGGILDRIDSLTAAAPIYATGMLVLSLIFS